MRMYRLTNHIAFSFCCLLALMAALPTAAQLPPSICSPLGGKRADIVSVQMAYRAPGGAMPTFSIPAGATNAFVTISNHISVVASPTSDQNLGDEDFVTTNASLNLATSRSSGFLNYAQSTNPSFAEVNLFSWINLPFGSWASTQIAQGQSAPTLLNDIRFTVSGSTLTVAESNANTYAVYMVEFTSAATNSLIENGFQRAVMTGGLQTSSTPIPANTNLIVISKKGTVALSNYSSAGGTEEGYSSDRLIIDVDAGRTNGHLTVSNGASLAFRSNYAIVNHPSTSTSRFLASGNATGDLASKSTTNSANTSDVGIGNPAIYISGGNLVIDRDAAYRASFDDVYIIEFYRRTGNPMAVEFIETQSRFLAVGQGTTSGTSRVFDVPAGAEYVILRQAGNANNAVNVHNENALSSYAVIDLKNETATGYFYQQVGFGSAILRRDDNFGFRNLPLNGTSARNASFSAGVYTTGATVYDVSFSLSADKSKLTVTNSFGLIAANYQVISVADFFGSRPDYAFTVDVNSDFAYTNNGQCGSVRVTARLCNPGSGNSPGGIPIAFYDKNPTTDATARLVHLSSFNPVLAQGTCADFSFDINLRALGITNPNATLFAITNDNGSFVPGGVGSAVGTTFTLASLANQGGQYRECDYTNNIVSFSIAGVMPCSNGTVFRDANGLTNNQIDGSPLGIAGGSQLFVNVINSLGNVVFVSPVSNADGSFTAQPNTSGNFRFQLSTTAGTVGQPAAAATLPAGWVATGENSSTGTGSDGTPNGELPITGMTTTAAFSTLLGLQQLPTGQAYTGYGWQNPGGTDVVNVPSSAFRGSDPEDGTYANNLNGRKLTLQPATGGTLYYNGVAITVPTVITNFNNDLVDIDPTADGNTSVSFGFNVWDNADFPAATPSLISMGFGGTILPATGWQQQARRTGTGVQLSWSTLTEANTRHFEVQRSTDGRQYQPIGQVAAAGQSQLSRSYHFTDQQAPATQLYYRVVLHDADGRTTVGATLPVAAAATTLRAWPNPMQTSQQLLLPVPGAYRLVWTNAQGQVVRQQQADATGQQPAISWQRQQLQPGLYLLQATHLASRQQYQLQVVVQ